MAYLRLFWHRHLAYLQRGSLTSRSRRPVATLVSLAHIHVAVNGRRMHVCVRMGWRVNRFRWWCVILFSSLLYHGGVDMSFGADTDVDVQEEGRLVSLRYTRLTLVQKRILGARLVSSLWGCIPNAMVVDLRSLLDTLRSRCTPVISQRFPSDYRLRRGRLHSNCNLRIHSQVLL